MSRSRSPQRILALALEVAVAGSLVLGLNDPLEAGEGSAKGGKRTLGEKVPACLEYGPPTTVTIQDGVLPPGKDLWHISGIVPSWNNAGPNGEDLYWVVQNVSDTKTDDHKDLYLIAGSGARAGKLLAKIRIAEGEIYDNYDWEDLGIGPCPDGAACLHIADTGEHDYPRLAPLPEGGYPEVEALRVAPRILRFPEPALSAEDMQRAFASPTPIDLGRVTPDIFPVKYPDFNPECGRRAWRECEARFAIHDAEGIIVDPETGEVYLVAKQLPEAHVFGVVYRYPGLLTAERRNRLVELERVAAAGNVPGGAGISPDGLRVVIRDSVYAHEYSREKGEPFDALFEPGRIPLPIYLCDRRDCGNTIEPQGEAITYTPDGGSIVTTSKTHTVGQSPQLRFYQCTRTK